MNKNKNEKDRSKRNQQQNAQDTKYYTDAKITNTHCESITNPTVQADEQTEMNSPIPSQENVEASKEYQEENER